MDTKRLKQKILSLAMTGRLTSQNPADEPASELLKGIRKEKDKLIGEGKLKKSRNEVIIFRGDDNKFYKQKEKTVTCVDDQMPFGIPESWEWVNLSQITRFRLGKTPPRDNEQFWNEGKFNWVAISDMADYGHVSTTREKISSRAEPIMGNLSPAGTLIMSFKLTIGRTSLLEIPAYHNEAIISIFPYMDKRDALRDYLFYILPLVANSGDAKEAIKGKTLNKKSIGELLIPLPPLGEQKRIVKEVECWLSKIDHIERVCGSLTKTTKQMRKRLLAFAITGRIVPQDSNDEPASELIKRVRDERVRLVKEGKLKKYKNETVISRGDDKKFYEQKGKSVTCIDEQIPFEIPDSWEWCRMGSIISLISGRDLEPDQYNSEGKGIPYMTGASNFAKGNLIVNRWTQKPVTISKLGDLLITCKGTIGAMAFNNLGDMHVARQIMAIRGILVNLGYIREFLEFNVGLLESQAVSLIPGISRGTLLNALIPIPPLAEQKRIVEKLKSLFAVLDTLNAIVA